MITKRRARKAISIYKNAWESQDAEKILTIFTKDATYKEKAFKKPLVGHEGIRHYWQEKVVKRQSGISFRLLNLYVEKKTAIAEWEANFFDRAENKKKRLMGVAIMEFQGNKIRALREYWDSKW